MTTTLKTKTKPPRTSVRGWSRTALVNEVRRLRALVRRREDRIYELENKHTNGVYVPRDECVFEPQDSFYTYTTPPE